MVALLRPQAVRRGTVEALRRKKATVDQKKCSEIMFVKQTGRPLTKKQNLEWKTLQSAANLANYFCNHGTVQL